MACAGYVSWNFSQEPAWPLRSGSPAFSPATARCTWPPSPGRLSDRLFSHKVSGSWGFGLPVPVGEFWQPKKSKVQAVASAVVFLQLHFIWARGEHLPLEAPAGGSEAKFREQSLPPRLGVVPLAGTQPDSVLMGPRSSSRACGRRRGLRRDAGNRVSSSQ